MKFVLHKVLHFRAEQAAQRGSARPTATATTIMLLLLLNGCWLIAMLHVVEQPVNFHRRLI